MKREDKKKMIMDWMQEHADKINGELFETWVSPTEIGMEVFGLDYARASGVASPLCKELVKEKQLIRNKRGWYRVRT